MSGKLIAVSSPGGAVVDAIAHPPSGRGVGFAELYGQAVERSTRTRAAPRHEKPTVVARRDRMAVTSLVTVSDLPFRAEPMDGMDGVRLSGELDIASYEVAEAALAPLFEAKGDVTIDVSELEFVDSSGLRLFIRLRQALGDRGELILRSPLPHVARVVEIAGLRELGVRLEQAE
jgi:anti-anti-sigma factor